MTDAPAIRTASTADLAAVRDLLLRTWRMTYIPRHGARKVEAIIRRWHNDERLLADIGDESAVFLLAEIDGRVVGHAFAQTAGATGVRLQRLYVDPDRHRQGIGTTLLEEIIDRLDHSVLRLSLEVDIQGSSAIAFYQRHGFVEAGRTTCSGPEDDSDIPAVLMVRDLGRHGNAGRGEAG